MFTKRLRGYQNLSYSARLTKAGLSSLELRRVRADLVLCFKMLHGLIDLSNSAQLFVVDKNSRTRGHCWKLVTAKPRLDTRGYSFAYCTARVWKRLSSDTVNAGSVKEFKACLDGENLSYFLTNMFEVFTVSNNLCG